MRADDFLDDSSADAFLDGAPATPKAKPAPSFKEQVYSTLNNLFRTDASVMDGYEGTGNFDPVAAAKVDRLIAEPTARSLPELPQSVGVLEKGARGGVAQLAKSGLGLVQGVADATGMDTVGKVAAGAVRRADQFASNPLNVGQIEGFTPDSIVQDLPKAGAGAISSIISNLPALAAGVVVPGAGLPLMGAQSGAAEYAEGRANGLTPIAAALRAVPMAGAEVLGEKVGGFNTVAKGLRGAIDEGSVVPLARAMMSSGVREVPGEELTTGLHVGIDKLPGIGLNQEATLADLKQQMKDTALQTVLQSAGMVGAGGALGGIAGNQAQPEQTQPQTAPADIKALTQAIADSATVTSRLQTKPKADDYLDEVDAVRQAVKQTPAPVVTEADMIPRAESAPKEPTNEQTIQPDTSATRLPVDAGAAVQPVPAAVPDAAVTEQKTVRLYHGGEPGNADGPLWFSRDRNYAQGYADKSNGRVWYVDVPADNPLVKEDTEFGTLPPTNLELPAELASKRKLLETTPKATNAQPQTPAVNPADAGQPADAMVAGNAKAISAAQVGQPVTQQAASGVLDATAGGSQPAPAAFEYPAQLSERATQIDTPTEGLRPGDIVAASGKPFKTKAQAQKEAKLAGKGWTVKKGGGGFVIRHQPATDKQVAAGKKAARAQNQIDTERDSLFAAIAKLGGINIDQLTKQWGFDPAEFKSLRVGIKPVARRTGGMSLDRAAESLAELGYLSYDESGQHDLSELFDLFDGELRGSKHYTPQGYANQYREMEEARIMELSEQDIEGAGFDALPDDGRDAIEEALDNYDELLTEDEAAIEARLEREGIEADSAAVLDRTDGEVANDPRAEEGNDRSAAEAAAQTPRQPGAAESSGNAAEGARVATGNPLRDNPASWVVREKATKKVLFETYDRKKVDALNTAKYEAVPIYDYLTGLNRDLKNFPDVPFSRGGSSLTVDAVRAAIASDTLNHDVDVYQTIADAPDYVRRQAEREGADDVEGFFDPRTNRVALIASNLSSPERAREVARHELIGHYGLENMVGQQEMDKLAARVIQAEKDGNKVIRELAAQVDKTQPDLSAQRRAKEIIAVMAERNIQNSITKRVIDAIRKFLREVGLLRSDITDAEIAGMLREAQAYLRDKGRGMVAGDPSPAFSRFGEKRELNLDAPLSQQSYEVRYALRGEIKRLRAEAWNAENQLRDPDTEDQRITGRQLVEIITDRLGSESEAIAYLNALGVEAETHAAFSNAPTPIEEGRPLTREEVLAKQEADAKAAKEEAKKPVAPKAKPVTADQVDMFAEQGSLFSRAADTQDNIELDNRDPFTARDFVSAVRDSSGRRRWAAGSKAYERLTDVIEPMLAKVKLSDSAPAAFKQMMRDFQADQQKALTNARKVAELGTQTLTAEERVLVSDIIEKNLAASDLPPENVVQIAADINAALKQQAQDLVDLGMATDERLIANYLPRAYRNPLLARITSKEQFVSWYQKAKLRINGNRLKSRGMVNTVRIDDIAKFQKLGWKISSMTDGEQIPADLLKALEDHTAIPPQYATKDMKVLMWRDFTADERAKMGEIRDGILRYALGYTETQRDIAIGRLFKAIADNDELSSKVNPGGWTKVPDQQVPGTELKRYGALSGLYVPPYVRDVIERSTQPKGPLMQVYDKALSFWKEGKTVWNPVSHGNNVISNVFVMHFAGLNPASPKPWRQTVREYRTKGRYYTEAVDHGLFGVEFASKDIQELFLPELTGELDAETVVASRFNKVVEFLKKTGKPVTWYRDQMQKAYEFEDQFFKLMLFIDRRENGASIEDAIADTERYIFNYSDVPEGVQLIKRTLSPFFSYTYKALPMVVHTAMTRPDRLLMPVMLLGGANWLAYAMMGGDEEEERRGMPDYLQGRTFIGTPKAVRMPFNIGERPAFMDISRRVPLGDLFDLHNQTGGMAVPAPFMPSHPMLTATAAMLFNIDTFTGKDLVQKSDTSWEAAEKRAGWIYKQIAPNAPFVPGSWNFDKLMNGAANAFDTEMAGYTGYTKAGDPIPLATALLDVAGGTKIRSFDPERGMDFKRSAIDREFREIDANIRSAKRSKAMTDDAKNEYIAEQKRKQDELKRERSTLR